MKLSILIPSTEDRNKMVFLLLEHLHNQIEKENVVADVEIITDIDNGEISVGAKRQRLIEKARGEYLIFIDSDDWVSDDYLKLIISAIGNNPDVVGFNGYMTHNGINREGFQISKDLSYITIKDAKGNNFYSRHTNHLCPIKREIALKIGYRDMKFQEDYDYAVRLKKSGLLKTEHFIDSELYHYKYVKNK